MKMKSKEIQYMRKKLAISKKQCTGLIQKKGIVKFKYDYIDEFNELFCVIAGYKPMVAMYLTNNRLMNLRKYKDIINSIILLARKNNIKVIINTQNDDRYVMGFPMKNLEAAILGQYMYSTIRGQKLKNHYLMGKLLGYSEANIKEFYKRAYKRQGVKQYTIDKKNNKRLIKLIKSDIDFKQFNALSQNNIIDFPFI